MMKKYVVTKRRVRIIAFLAMAENRGGMARLLLSLPAMISAVLLIVNDSKVNWLVLAVRLTFLSDAMISSCSIHVQSCNGWKTISSLVELSIEEDVPAPGADQAWWLDGREREHHQLFVQPGHSSVGMAFSWVKCSKRCTFESRLSTDQFDWEGRKIKRSQKKTPRKCPFQGRNLKVTTPEEGRGKEKVETCSVVVPSEVGSFGVQWRSSPHNRGLFQRLSGNEVRGIACEKRLRCACFWFDLSYLFDFGKPTIDHCCLPRFFNGRRTSPSLSYHSFPLSNELRNPC